MTGYWSEKAAKEAEKYGKVNWVVPKPDKYQSIETVESSSYYRMILFHRCSTGKYLEINRKFFLFLLLFERNNSWY